ARPRATRASARPPSPFADSARPRPRCRRNALAGPVGRPRLDPRGRVRVGLVQRLVLEERLGERVEPPAMLLEHRHDLVVRAGDEPPDLLVDEPPRLLRPLGRTGEK